VRRYYANHRRTHDAWCQNNYMKMRFHSGCCILVLLSIFLVVATAADNMIVPGVRCDAFVLGKTTEKELSAIPKANGLDFQVSREGIPRHCRRGIQ
jgi:hypothetical protein